MQVPEQANSMSSSSSSSSSTASSHEPSTSTHQPTGSHHQFTSTEQVERVVDMNHLADVEDDVLSALQDTSPQTVLGLWPEYSLLNHSCVPNVSHFNFKVGTWELSRQHPACTVCCAVWGVVQHVDTHG